MAARDEEGAQGAGSTLTVMFDRSCLIWRPNPDVLTLATQADVDTLAVCTSVGIRRVAMIADPTGTDPIVSLLPMSDITVSEHHVA